MFDTDDLLADYSKGRVDICFAVSSDQVEIVCATAHIKVSVFSLTFTLRNTALRAFIHSKFVSEKYLADISV